jgi:hypothetical protein
MHRDCDVFRIAMLAKVLIILISHVRAPIRFLLADYYTHLGGHTLCHCFHLNLTSW